MKSKAGAGYLLDTNVLSETSKRKCNAQVLRFLESAKSSPAYVSILSIGELRRGMYRLQKRKQEPSQLLTQWVGEIERRFEPYTLGLDMDVIEIWAQFASDRDRSNIDTLLAATAHVHGLTFVTRNVKDVVGLPVSVLNPWEE